MNKIKYFIGIGIMMVVVSCNSSSNKTATSSDEKEMDKKEIKKEVEKALYPLPTSFELTNMLQEIEATYMFGITNDPQMAEKYFTKNVQAINLGIYTADLAYNITYNFKQEILNTLEGVKTLINELDLNSAVDPEFIEKIENSSENKDKLVRIISDLVYSVYDNFYNQGNESAAYLMLVGSWVEGMYITLNISDNTFDNPQIVDVIMKQEESLNKIITFLDEKESENELIEQLLTGLKRIKQTYELEEGSNSLTTSQVKLLNTQIEDIRTQIVE